MEWRVMPKEGSSEAAMADSAESLERKVMLATPPESMRVREIDP